MITPKQYEIIYQLIYRRNLYEALLQMQSYIKTINEQSLFNRWHSINENYKYLLNYFVQGMPDNTREQVFRGLQEEAFMLLDEIYDTITCDVPMRNFERIYHSHQQHYIDAPESSARLKCAFYKTFLAYPEEQTNEYILSLDEDEQFMAIYGLTVSLLRRFSKTHYLTLYHLSTQLDTPAATLCLAALWIITYQHPHRVEILTPVQEFQSSNISASNTHSSLFVTLQKTFMSTALTPKVEEVMKHMETKVAPEIQQHGLVVLEDDEDKPSWMKKIQTQMEEQVNKLFKLRHHGADTNYFTVKHLLYHTFFYDLANWFLPISAEEIGVQDNYKDLLQTLGGECDCACDFYAMALIAKQIGQQVSDQLKDILPSSPHQKEVSVTLPQTAEGISRNLIFTLYRLGKMEKWGIPDIFKNNKADQLPLLRSYANQLFPLSKEQEQELAEHAFRVGLYKEAALRFAKIRASIDPAEQGELLQQEGYAYEKMNALPQAIQRYQQAILLCEDNFSKRHLALLYAKAKEFDKAILLYNDLLQNTASSTPNHKRYLNNKAWCLQESKQWAEALQIYIQLEVLYPDNPSTQRDLAWTALLAHRLDYAIKYAKLLIEQDNPLITDCFMLALAINQSQDAQISLQSILPTEPLSKEERATLWEWLFVEKQADLIANGFTYSNLSFLFDAFCIAQ